MVDVEAVDRVRLAALPLREAREVLSRSAEPCRHAPMGFTWCLDVEDEFVSGDLGARRVGVLGIAASTP
jgi:hypothetical protein